MTRYATAVGLWLSMTCTVAAVQCAEPHWAAESASVTPDPQHGMVLFLKRCASCHGRHGWGDGPREIPSLAGQGESYLTEQLKSFVSGERPGSEMHGPAMRDSVQPPDVNRAQAVRDLTSYLAQAPRNPQPGFGDGRSLTQGKRSYTRLCATCHGAQGEGADPHSIPALGGQHYSYLVSQLRSFVSARLQHPFPVDEVSPQEQQAMADYASRLPYLSTRATR